MGDEVMTAEYPDNDARGGICYSQWNSKSKKEDNMEPKEIQELVQKGVEAGLAPLVSRVEALETTAKERAEKEAADKAVTEAAEKEAKEKAEKDVADKEAADKEAADKEAADKETAGKESVVVDPTLKAIEDRVSAVERLVTKSKGLPPSDEREDAEKAEKPNRDIFGRRKKSQ